MNSNFLFFILLYSFCYLLAIAKQKKLTTDADLLKASGDGNLEKVKHLIENEMGSITAKNNYGVSALIFAANNGHKSVVEALLQYGANIEDFSNNGRTSLHWACHWGHFPVVKFLVEKGANINTVDVEGMTPLMSAVYQKHSSIVKFLLKNGASLSFINENGADAIMIAKNQGNTDLLRVLESAKAKRLDKEFSSGFKTGKNKSNPDRFSLLSYLHYNYWKDLEQDTNPYVILLKLAISELIYLLEVGRGELLFLRDILLETNSVAWQLLQDLVGSRSLQPTPKNQQSEKTQEL